MGASVSSDITNTITCNLQEASNTILNNQNLNDHQGIFVNIIKIGDGNINANNLAEKSNASIDINALANALNNSSMNEDLNKKIAQTAKAAIKGVNLMQLGDANTTINDIVNTSIKVKNTAIQNLIIRFDQKIKINIYHIGKGNIKVKNVHLKEIHKIITKEVENAKNNNKDVTRLIEQFSQATESKVEGFSLKILSLIIFSTAFLGLGGVYVGGKIAFPVTLLLSILAFYQYFNWTDRTIFTDGFVDTMFNIDNDGCEALKNLTIENVKSAKGASDRCLKNPKCVAYNWNHNTKKITMFKGVLEEGCKNDILKNNTNETLFERKKLTIREGKKDPIMSTNGDLYLNTKNQTLWYNYKKKKQNNWKELKNEKKIILDNSIKLGIDKFIKIIFGYEEKLPGPMPHTLYIDYSHNNHLKIFLCKLNFLIGKDFKNRDQSKDWTLISTIHLDIKMLDFEENDSCGVIVEQNKLWLLCIAVILLFIGIIGMGLGFKKNKN